MNRLLTTLLSYNSRKNVAKTVFMSTEVVNKVKTWTPAMMRPICLMTSVNNNMKSKHCLLWPSNGIQSMVTIKHFATTRSDTKDMSTTRQSALNSDKQTAKSKKRRKKTAIVNTTDSFLPIMAFSTADEYNMDELADGLKEQGLYDLNHFNEEVEDVLHLTAKYEINNIRREAFIFREGTIVCWNMPFVECEAIINLLKHFENNSYDKSLVEEEQEVMPYELVNSKSRLQKGLICLANKSNESLLERYAFSDAIAMSVKLAIWEAMLDKYIQSIEFVSQDMKAGNKLRLTRDQVFKKAGELFDLKHHINLSSDLLDTPDFYWDRHELEKLFLDTIYFLNIKKRTNVMNEKLNHCIELMELLSNNLNHRHGAQLEWMIIVLIMVEVLFEFIHYADRIF
ncbi:required for meiotic nuclear division protein 1 homolog [Oppia nitens]|uniref:required for meiotic nuclear division protein 1 homolog n=1 Tax=Oppia nitens TaxID=1686743 RepID=UPI0023DC849C|nr:required for meiotic nuclear division protein 1 homolog [Oppia nitens]